MAGNIKIIEPKDNFQKVSKGIIFNRDIDVLTLGIYVKVLCLGKEWQLNIQGLAQTLNLSEAKIKSSFSLLEREGYVKRIHVKDEVTGRFLGFDYHIGFEPFPEDERTDLVATHGRKEPNHPKTQRLENPTVGKPNGWEIQRLENREDIYRDNNINRDKKEDREVRGSKSLPTRQEVRDYCKERNNAIDPDYFYDKMESVGWTLKSGQKVKDWRATIRTWEKYDKPATPAIAPVKRLSTNDIANR